MANCNKHQHWPQSTGLGVMIIRCTLDSQHEDPICTLRMLDVLLSGTQTIFFSDTEMMNKLTTQIKDHSVRNGQRNKASKHYILGATIQKDSYRKIIGIWKELVRFKTTNKKIAYPVWTITRKLVFWLWNACNPPTNIYANVSKDLECNNRDIKYRKIRNF